MKRLFLASTSGILPLALMAAGADTADITMQYVPGAPDSVVLTWEAVPGQSYNLLASETLALDSWGLLNTAPLVAQTDLLSFEDTNLSLRRFYQVQQIAEPPVQVTLSGISEQAWRASDDWVPATLPHTVSGSKSLISLGCWWDGHYLNPSPLPTDSNGVFSRATTQNVGLSDAPVQVQIAYQSAAAIGSHTIVPPPIGGSGDGFLLLLEAEGLAAGSPVRDSGRFRISHPIFGYNDPNSIESITVSTDGDAAQPGDLAVAIFVMDPIANPDINISLPAGWTSLGFNDVVVDNVGYRACYRVVPTAGKQSVTCSWTDGSTFVAEAAIVVFKAGE